MLVGVVRIEGPVLGPTSCEDALMDAAVQEADGIVPGHEFLVQPGMLVVHAGVDHGDDHAFSADAEVPCALRVHCG